MPVQMNFTILRTTRQLFTMCKNAAFSYVECINTAHTGHYTGTTDPSWKKTSIDPVFLAHLAMLSVKILKNELFPSWHSTHTVIITSWSSWIRNTLGSARLLILNPRRQLTKAPPSSQLVSEAEDPESASPPQRTAARSAADITAAPSAPDRARLSIR